MKSIVLMTLGFALGFSSYSQTRTNESRNGKPFIIRPVQTQRMSSGRKSLPSIKELVRLNKGADLVPVSEGTDIHGYHQQKFAQLHKGIKVEYGTVSVNSKNGIVETVAGEVYDISDTLPGTASLAESAALQTALKYVGAQQYRWQSEKEELPKGELVYVKNYLLQGKDAPGEMVLAWKFDIYATQPISRRYIYIDAHANKVVHDQAIIKHLEAPAVTRYSGTQTISTSLSSTLNKYVLRDEVKGIETYNMNRGLKYSDAVDFKDNDNAWTGAEWENKKKDNVALDAHWGATKTYDYFKEKHGRDSYDDEGSKIKSYVHFFENYVNAFWNGQVMTYGDGNDTVDPLTSLDICAHEIGHAVCSSTADLVYLSESGALNEGLSDIWGATIEHYAAPEKSTWDLGEDINHVFRSMSNPKEHRQPDTYKGDFWYVGVEDAGGVHTNSGVINHWYYMLVSGATGTNDDGINYSVQGIGFDKAADVVYRMETVYLTANARYPDARSAAIEAATDIFGEDSNEVMQVTNAWDAVGVYHEPPALTATQASDTSVGLEWTDNVTGEIGFVLERLDNGTFQVLQTLAPDATTYTDTNLQTGKIYYYRIKTVFGDRQTEYSSARGVALGVDYVVMRDTTTTVQVIETCNAVLLDPGGLDDYADNTFGGITLEIRPSEPGKKVKIDFTAFDVGQDRFEIYGSPPIIGYTGNTLPPEVNATNSSGILTLQFWRGALQGNLGWEAHITCTVVPEAPSALTATPVSPTQINLSWSDQSDNETGFIIERGDPPALRAFTRSDFPTSFTEIARVGANVTTYADTDLATDNIFEYRVRAIKETSYSLSTPIAEAIIGNAPIMDGWGQEYRGCNKYFTDPYANGPYLGIGTFITLAPDQPGTRISIHFTEFDMEEGMSYMRAFQGGIDFEDANGLSALKFISSHTGSTLPPTFTANRPDGKLSFVVSAASNPDKHSGWRAWVSCITPPVAPSSLSAQLVPAGQIDLTWRDNAQNETGYVIERTALPNGVFETIGTIAKDATSFQDHHLTGIDKVYYYRVRPVYEGTALDPSNVATVSVGNPSRFVIMQSGTEEACNRTFVDSGIDDHYRDNEDLTITLAPSAPGLKVAVNFTHFDLEAGYDSLYVHDGRNNDAPLLGAFTGTELPGALVASNPEGKLTFRFTSDATIQNSGWEASVTCLGDVLGIEDPIPEIRIWPVPAKEQLNILSEGEPMASIVMTDVLGRKTLELTPGNTEQQIDLAPFPPGMYILQIVTQLRKKVSRRVEIRK